MNSISAQKQWLLRQKSTICYVISLSLSLFLSDCVCALMDELVMRRGMGRGERNYFVPKECKRKKSLVLLRSWDVLSITAVWEVEEVWHLCRGRVDICCACALHRVFSSLFLWKRTLTLFSSVFRAPVIVNAWLSYYWALSWLKRCIEVCTKWANNSSE